MPYLDRDGVRINYQTFGPPPDGATALLLTHGFSASSAMWQPNIEALTAARPVITWDLRGHGSSDAPDDPARSIKTVPIPCTWAATPRSRGRPTAT